MKHEIVAVVIALILAILLGVGLWQGVISMTDISAWVTPAILGAIVAVLLWGFRDRIDAALKGKAEPQKVEVVNFPQSQPVLNLRPLPHYRGYPLPPKIEILPDLPDGQHQAQLTNVGASTPEYNLLEISQKLEVMKGTLGQTMNELIAKFGVIRVHCISGDALNCKAQARVRIIELYGQVHPTNFVDWGYLNWFSVEIKSDVMQNKFDEIYPVKQFGLNKYLKNTIIDLHQGDEKDLLVFYMIKDLPNVFLCTNVEIANAGSVFSGGQTLKFEIEIGITAQGYPRTTWSYFVTINDFDDFKIETK